MVKYLNPKADLTEAEREAEFMYWLDISTERSAIEGARKEATVETKNEMAKKLRALGVDLDTIAKASGLSIEKIKLL